MRSFRARGGKLIQYHGWGDAAVAPQGSIDYYELVRAFMTKYMDARSDRSKPVEDFYRLYMVPGMGHCRGGNGANNFGNGATVAADDPERDLVAALDRWVEKGVAPDHFIGTGKGLTRPLCVYPKTAHYKGSGDTNDAANFTCSQSLWVRCERVRGVVAFAGPDHQIFSRFHFQRDRVVKAVTHQRIR